MTHDDLLEIGARWLRDDQMSSFVIREPHSWRGERPDLFGYNHADESVVVECKASTADFRADQSKQARTRDGLGMGERRWYLAPRGVVPREELPPGWGLLLTDGQCVLEEVAADHMNLSATQLRWERRLISEALGSLQRGEVKSQASTEKERWLQAIESYVVGIGGECFASEAVRIVGRHVHKSAMAAVVTIEEAIERGKLSGLTMARKEDRLYLIAKRGAQ